MGKFIAEQTIKHMITNGSAIKGAKVNVLGLTFKENVPDLRNSRVIDVINELRSYGVRVFVHDPVPLPEDARHEYGIELLSWDQLPTADAMIAAVAHREFLKTETSTLAQKVNRGGCFVDVKSAFDAAALRQAGLCVWRL
jgi:UDP-N-acetyl-D-galactosamine dehydrogenase